MAGRYSIGTKHEIDGASPEHVAGLLSRLANVVRRYVPKDQQRACGAEMDALVREIMAGIELEPEAVAS